MNILFLDDSTERLVYAKMHIPGVIAVDTAQEAIQKLSEPGKVWDYVFLDHDLGGETFVDSRNKNTGAEVVRWIVQNKSIVTHYIIHSHNPYGASSMQNGLLLTDAYIYCAPFGGDDFNIIIKEITEE